MNKGIESTENIKKNRKERSSIEKETKYIKEWLSLLPQVQMTSVTYYLH